MRVVIPALFLLAAVCFAGEERVSSLADFARRQWKLDAIHDPDMKQRTEALRKACRGDIERASFEQVQTYLLCYANEYVSVQTDYKLVRSVLAEYQTPWAPMPFSVPARGTRLLPVPPDEPTSLDYPNGRSGSDVHAERMRALDDTTLALDMAIAFPLPLIQSWIKERGENDVTYARALWGLRLEYLAASARLFYAGYLRMPRPLFYAAWTPDARAAELLEEHRRRLKTDVALDLPDAPTDLFKIALRQVDELVALNKVVLERGAAFALATCQIEPGERRESQERDCVASLFREYLFFRKDGEDIAAAALKTIAKQYKAAPESEQQKRTLMVERAKTIVAACDECGWLDKDIVKEALGVERAAEASRWLDGKER